jgi:hypothetical protein
MVARLSGGTDRHSSDGTKLALPRAMTLVRMTFLLALAAKSVSCGSCYNAGIRALSMSCN